MSVPATIRPKTLGEIAREILDDAGGMVAPAVDRLQAMIAADDELRLSIAQAAIDEYARRRVLGAMHSSRQTVWAAGQRRAAGPASVVALANGISASLLNFPLAGGVRLGAATRPQVERQATLYATMGADMLHKARWLTMIAARLPDDAARVGDVLTSGEVETLQAETANA